MNKKYRVLLVDDDKFLLGMYRKKLMDAGMVVDAAVGATEALVKLRDNVEFDILIIDIIMPTMDGLELLKTIRAEKLVPHASVIMLTNESDSDRIEQARALDVKGYLVKANYIPSEIVEEVLKVVKLNK